MSTKLMVIVFVGSIVVLFVGVNISIAVRRAAMTPQFWEMKRNEPIRDDDVRLVALGDSSTQAIGASQPMKGFVGRSADYIHEQIGRSVHIDNRSEGGASLKHLKEVQLLGVDLQLADLVLISAPADFQRKLDLQQFKDDLTKLLDAVPADKTIISDLPLLPGRDPYQAILAECADARGVGRADFAKVFNGEGRRLDIFSWLPPHVNDRGYLYWFKAFQPQIDILLQQSGLSEEDRS